MVPFLPSFLRNRILKWVYVGPPPAYSTAKGKQSLTEMLREAQKSGGHRSSGEGASAEGRLRAEQATVAVELRTACPFSSPTVEAFATTTPPALLGLCARSGGALNPARLWTTLLCMAFLRVQREHFLVEARYRIACMALLS